MGVLYYNYSREGKPSIYLLLEYNMYIFEAKYQNMENGNERKGTIMLHDGRTEDETYVEAMRRALQMKESFECLCAVERSTNMDNFISAYNRAPALSVYGAYKHPSDAKVRAERAVLREMDWRDGWGYKIINHNCQHFTAGYLFADPETGVITLCVHTAQNAYETDWHDTARVV